MASILKHLRSSTANKRPTASGLADGQIAINTASGTPALFFKDNASNIVKVGPAHVGSTAPNISPAGSAGNSTGELWVDNGLTTNGLKYYNGTAFVNLTPSGTTSTIGLVELATDAETQAGTDAARAVTPSGLQSKISDSTSTSSSTTIASSTAVKSAYDLADAALPKAGGTITGAVTISPSGSLVFEGSTDDSFETTLAIVDPTADRTITLPNVTGTVVTTGDSGTVTSTMIADGTIVDGDINASAAIAHTKLANITAGSVLMGNASNVPTATALSGDVTVSSSGVTAISSGVIVNADVNASAAIAGTKISPDFGSQNTTTTGTSTAASFIPTSSTAPTNGVYLPSANNVAISTNGSNRLQIDSSGNVGIGAAPVVTFAGQTHLTVNHSAGGTSVAGYNLAVNGTRYASLITYPSNSEALRVTAESATLPITFHTNSSERMRLDSSGRLGLGTSSPSTTLSVAGGISGTAGMNISGAGWGVLPYVANSLVIDNNSGEARFFATGANATTKGSFIFYNGETDGGASAAMVIDTSSRVGIGTTSPGDKLQIGDYTSSNVIRITSSTSGSGSIFFGDGSTGNDYYRGYVQYSHSDESLQFGTGASERGRFDSSGRFLVGTSSTSATTRAVFQGNSANASGTGIVQLATGNTSPASGDQLGRLEFGGSTNVGAASIIGDRDGGTWTNGSSQPSRLVFSTTADGASSPTERMRIQADGVIRFSSAVYNNTTVNAANMFLNTSPDYQIYRSTSSIKYKTDVETLENSYADAILNCRPVWYRSLCNGDRKDYGYWGFIAEEVGEIDPRLVFWTTEKTVVEEDGTETTVELDQPEADGVQYDRFIPHLLNLIKRQKEQIEAMEARLSVLEAS